MSSNFVFVLDTNKRPLSPCRPARARELLRKGRAAVFRHYPFTIILKRVVADAAPTACHLKLDPGSKTTGLALLQGDAVVWAAELTHRGAQISRKLGRRSKLRRNRRNRLRYRNSRYRTKGQINNAKRRYKNRKRLPPSLQHRIETTITWVKRIQQYAPVGEISQEFVRFDTQQMPNPEISGVEYQQGTLQGYEVKEYLLEKWKRTCVYCGAQNTPLQVDHVVPKARGGSDRVSNLTLSCGPCNQAKGDRDVQEFLQNKPQRLDRILRQLKTPLQDAAVINSTRWKLHKQLCQICSVVTIGSGGQTKYNRKRFGVPKTHWGDAACVGALSSLRMLIDTPLLITAKGQGGRQKAAVNRHGYPTRHNLLRPIHGWRSGDVGRCEGKTGRVTPRSNGSFLLTPHDGTKAFSRNIKKFRRVHSNDGFLYLSNR